MSKTKEIKLLKDLTLMDRFLFAEAIEDTEICQTILEIILGQEIHIQERPQAEKEIRKSQRVRSIRIDVYAQDSNGNIYDTEVQKRDTGNLPKRSRIYQGLLDSTLLLPGSVDFNQMKNCYIIMISPFDILGLGYYRYTYQMRCDEKTDECLDDGGVRIFLNTKGTKANGESQELIELLHYMQNATGETRGSFQSGKIRNLHERVQAIRNNEEIGVKYMQEWEERLLDQQEAKAEGKAEGRMEGLIAHVRRLNRKQMDAEVIADLLGEDIETVSEIQQIISSNPKLTVEQIFEHMK